MTEQLAVLKLVAARLDASGIPYMVTGSIAASYYAQPRMTRDIDLVAELDPPDAQRLADVLAPEFECDVETVRAAIARRTLFNLIHVEAVVKVDFVVRKETPYRREEFRRRRLVEIDGQSIWFVSPEDLILSKLVWGKESGSDVQLKDVRSLTADHRSLDWRYLERWARDLLVLDLLHEARHE